MGLEIQNLGEVFERVKAIEDAVADSKRRSLRYGAGLLRMDQRNAFARQSDPVSGMPWAKRSRTYSWPLMWKTGALMRMVGASWGANTRDGRPKLFGKLVGNVGKKDSIRAGALHFGRTGPGQSRWTAYRSRKRAKSGGGSDRYMPPRPFFGMSRDSQRKLARFWRNQVKAAKDK